MGKELENSSNKKYLLIFFVFIGVLGIILIIVFATKKNTYSPPANTTIPSCLSIQSCSDSTVCTCSDGTSCDSSTNSCKTTVPSCSGATYNCNDKSCACSVGTSCGDDGKCSSTNIPSCTGTYNCNDKSCACSVGTSCGDDGKCSSTNIPGCTGTYNCNDNSCSCPLGTNCESDGECVQLPIIIKSKNGNIVTLPNPLYYVNNKGGSDGAASSQTMNGCWSLDDTIFKPLKENTTSCRVDSITLPANITAEAYNVGEAVHWWNMCNGSNTAHDCLADSTTTFPDSTFPDSVCGFWFKEKTV